MPRFAFREDLKKLEYSQFAVAQPVSPGPAALGQPARTIFPSLYLGEINY